MLRAMIGKSATALFCVTGRFHGVRADIHSNISPRVLANWTNKMRGSGKYPITIHRSVVGDITAKEGCRIDHAVCAGKIELGRFVSINGPATRLSSRIHGIRIGSFTSIASNVVIQEDYHDTDRVTTYFIHQNVFRDSLSPNITSKGPIVIEEDVWIGSGSVILSGVTIGRGSVIGAGSIVTKDIPRYSVAVGNPARAIKRRFSDEIIGILEQSEWWERDTAELSKIKEAFLLNLSDEHNAVPLQQLMR